MHANPNETGIIRAIEINREKGRSAEISAFNTMAAIPTIASTIPKSKMLLISEERIRYNLGNDALVTSPAFDCMLFIPPRITDVEKFQIANPQSR